MQSSSIEDSYDRNALIAFQSGGDPWEELISWTATGDPCSRSASWFGVLCDGLAGDASQRRIVYLSLSDTGVSGDVGDLAAVARLQHLDLHGSPAVHGDISRLSSLHELHYLDLSDTRVHGLLDQLSTLRELGAPYNMSGSSGLGRLDLRGTSCYGDATGLHALPGLGRGWSSFESCADYEGCGEPQDAVELRWLAGVDLCACCASAGDEALSPWLRDQATGDCVDPVCIGTDCGVHSYGCEPIFFSPARSFVPHCPCHTGYSNARCQTHEGSIDQTALIEFMRRADSRGLVRWSGSAEPCGVGWERPSVGWRHVACDALGGRVEVLMLPNADFVADLGHLASLSALKVLILDHSRHITGDIYALSGLQEMLHIDLRATAVYGDAASLRNLTHIGEEYSDSCTGVTSLCTSLKVSGGLWLGDSAVHGSAAALRSSLLMLGAAWGTGPGGSEDFTSCDSFDGCEIVQGGDESSLQLRPNADSLIGTDQCACCLNTEYVRGTDGSCAADPRCSPAELAELECGENAFCSAGECVCMPGWEDPPSCLTFAGSEESDVSGLLALRQGHDPQSELVTWHASTAPCTNRGQVGGSELVEPVVTAMSSSLTCPSGCAHGWTTYVLSLTLNAKAGARNCYAIFGDATTLLSVPASYQEPTPFGVDVAGVPTQFVAVVPSAAYDSYLSVGITEGNSAGSLSSIGIDFDSWTESSALLVDDGAVFWMDPAMGPGGNVTVAQLTVPMGSSAVVSMGAQGRSSMSTDSAVGQLDDWREDGFQFIIGDAAAAGGSFHGGSEEVTVTAAVTCEDIPHPNGPDWSCCDAEEPYTMGSRVLHCDQLLAHGWSCETNNALISMARSCAQTCEDCPQAPAPPPAPPAPPEEESYVGTVGIASTWRGIQCEAGRVVSLELTGLHITGSIEQLAPGLSHLRALSLGHCTAITGDVGSLTRLPELRYVDLEHTSVSGHVAQLTALSHIGETTMGSLYLTQTLVYGSIAPLRAMPGLGGQWDSYSPCTQQHFLYQPSEWSRAHITQYDTAGVTAREICEVVVHDASTMAGTDPCACCARDLPARPDTGALPLQSLHQPDLSDVRLR